MDTQVDIQRDIAHAAVGVVSYMGVDVYSVPSGFKHIGEDSLGVLAFDSGAVDPDTFGRFTYHSGPPVYRP